MSTSRVIADLTHFLSQRTAFDDDLEQALDKAEDSPGETSNREISNMPLTAEDAADWGEVESWGDSHDPHWRVVRVALTRTHAGKAGRPQ